MKKSLALLSILLTSACAGMFGHDTSPYADVAYANRCVCNALLAEDHAKAEAIAREAEPLNPDSVLLALFSAEAHAKVGQHDAAVASLSRALACKLTDEQRMLALRNRATLYIELGRPGDAAADLESAIACGGASAELSRELGAAAYAAGDFAKARAAWQGLAPAERDEIDAIVGPGFFAGAGAPPAP